MCHDDYGALRRDAATEAPLEELQDAWLTIYSEYTALAGDPAVMQSVAKAARINQLSSKIDRVQTMLAVAGVMVHEGICKELAAEGYRIDPAASDETYHAQVAAAQSRLKTDVMRLQQMAKKQQGKGRAGDSKPTEADFEQTFFDICKNEERDISRSGLTVLQYATLVQRLHKRIRQIESLNRTNTKKHGR